MTETHSKPSARIGASGAGRPAEPQRRTIGDERDLIMATALKSVEAHGKPMTKHDVQNQIIRSYGL